MENIFVLALFLVFLPITAQDGYNQSREHYAQIHTITDNLSRAQTCDLTDLLISNAGYDYSFERVSETSNSLTYIFTLKEPTMKRKEVKLLTVHFRKNNDKFYFTAVKVASESSDAIYIWTQIFLPTATWDQVRFNYKYRDLMSPDGTVKIRLLNGDEIKSFRKEKQSKY